MPAKGDDWRSAVDFSDCSVNLARQGSRPAVASFSHSSRYRLLLVSPLSTLTRQRRNLWRTTLSNSAGCWRSLVATARPSSRLSWSICECVRVATSCEGADILA